VVVAWLIAVKKSRNRESLTSMRLKTLILEKCAKRNNADGGDTEVVDCSLRALRIQHQATAACMKRSYMLQ
jgi:hypothetical protein